MKTFEGRFHWKPYFMLKNTLFVTKRTFPPESEFLWKSYFHEMYDFCVLDSKSSNLALCLTLLRGKWPIIKYWLKETRKSFCKEYDLCDYGFQKVIFLIPRKSPIPPFPDGCSILCFYRWGGTWSGGFPQEIMILHKILIIHHFWYFS